MITAGTVYKVVFVRSNETYYLYIPVNPFLHGLAMFGSVGCFVIDVDECSLYIGEDLNRILELLANVMRFPQRCACIHDDVDLNEVIWAAVVRANGIDLFYLVAERHRLVNQDLNEIMGGGFPGQQFEFAVDPIGPSATDADGDDDSPDGIQEPEPLATTRRHEKAKSIDEQVIPVVLPKHLHLARVLPGGEAVQK